MYLDIWILSEYFSQFFIHLDRHLPVPSLISQSTTTTTTHLPFSYTFHLGSLCTRSRSQREKKTSGTSISLTNISFALPLSSPTTNCQSTKRFCQTAGVKTFFFGFEKFRNLIKGVNFDLMDIFFKSFGLHFHSFYVILTIYVLDLTSHISQFSSRFSKFS